MKRKDLQRALDAGGTVVIEGVVRVDRPLLVTKESRIEGGVLIGDADVVLLDVQAPTTIVGTEVARTGGFGHGIRTTSELVLDKVRVSGGRNWAWEKQRRPPLPTEGFGAGVFVASSGSLKAKGLVVSGCTGAGLTAEGPVRWTRGSARSCRWGLLCTSGATKVSRVSFRECSEGVFHDGRGDLSLKSCRIEENTVGLVAYGPGPTTVSGGSVKGNRASGVFAHLLGDLRLEGVAFEGNRSADIAACGWSDVKQTDCSLGEAGVAIEDLARVDGERGPAGDLQATLRDWLGRTRAEVRGEILARSFARSKEFDHLKPVEVLVVHWGTRAMDWLAEPGRRVLWSAHLAGHKRRIQVDPSGGIWFHSEVALLSEGVRIEPGGHRLALGEIIALARPDGVYLFELDGSPVGSSPWPPTAGELLELEVVSREEIRGLCSCGVGYDAHPRRFTWHVAENRWTDEYDPQQSAPFKLPWEVLAEAPWLGVEPHEVSQVWHDETMGAFALDCDVAVVLKRVEATT